MRHAWQLASAGARCSASAIGGVRGLEPRGNRELGLQHLLQNEPRHDGQGAAILVGCQHSEVEEHTRGELRESDKA